MNTIRKIRKYFLATLLFIVLLVGCGYSQDSSQALPSSNNQESVQAVASTSGTVIPFDSNKWEFNAKTSTIQEFLGKKSLLLEEGTATIKNANFTDGIIEYDIVLPNGPGFLGTMFRMEDHKNFEELYIRSTRSGLPDAVQYNPIHNDVLSWQLFSSRQEPFTATAKFNVGEWTHVKIAVLGKNAEIYVQEMEKPALFVDLKREVKPGDIGLIAIQDSAPGYFANFSYTTTKPTLKGSPKETPAVTPGTVKSWLVSNTFSEKLLDGKYLLSNQEQKQLTWKKLPSYPSGVTNLAIVAEPTPEKDTVFAKVTIVSDKEQFKTLDFGFCNRVKVYLNGQKIYGGNDDFFSRDYRFMGTLGYFDQVYLPLKKGKNEVWLAVSSGFPTNGWGLQAKIDDLTGISFEK
ncbi:MAG TPA: hypothetical protein DEG17_16600 [Cyanobacteria bacterium UBA11149]|nr:hypothetical protein [Cyanobacteria bacterium UBA11367]HBE59903.1 hypothetical protein [Cyanobacteria bacterium UBA11366]HBR75859.1 hypothetical protein [Cyanobacteria bacterium UBA11159]HBS69281.1 hypothetical protein [Cyanobacteria bacterium UBA11153]HBW90442.1 hypothetical protein [Cyanobacteria bacterium UBA11149]HCA96636.1 hypothetical protein [Cyanobacteria bacterium UBA9226]